jgi:hypothetical protein
MDVSGNRSLRRLALAPRTAMFPYTPSGPAGEGVWVPPAVRDTLIAETRRLGQQLIGLREGEGTPHLKREVLLFFRMGKGEPQRFVGRYLVRLTDLPREIGRETV